MSLTLYFHPLSSYCQKVLIALYENGTKFVPRLIDLANPDQRAELVKLWPFGKFPVLRDDAGDRTIPESSIIIEYLSQHYPGGSQLLPADVDLARQARLGDRFFDHYVMEPMTKLVDDRLRPAEAKDRMGVKRATATLLTAYEMIERDMGGRTWAMGDVFTIADCAAAPALFYAGRLVPFGDRKNLAGYFDRLTRRPCFARVVEEAKPYMANFPG